MSYETRPGVGAIAVTVATATYPRSRGVDVCASGDYDFCFDGTTWVLFKGRVAGVLYPYEVYGVRHADDSAPDAGDIVLIY